jgi:hypothetical protein
LYPFSGRIIRLHANDVNKGPTASSPFISASMGFMSGEGGGVPMEALQLHFKIQSLNGLLGQPLASYLGRQQCASPGCTYNYNGIGFKLAIDTPHEPP